MSNHTINLIQWPQDLKEYSQCIIFEENKVKKIKIIKNNGSYIQDSIDHYTTFILKKEQYDCIFNTYVVQENLVYHKNIDFILLIVYPNDCEDMIQYFSQNEKKYVCWNTSSIVGKYIVQLSTFHHFNGFQDQLLMKSINLNIIHILEDQNILNQNDYLYVNDFIYNIPKKSVMSTCPRLYINGKILEDYNVFLIPKENY